MRNIVRWGWIGLCLLQVPGCVALDQNASRTNQMARTSYDNLRERVSGYVYMQPEEQPDVQTHLLPLPTFCYQLMMDSVCYSEPQPHLHTNLISVQGEHQYGTNDFLPSDVLPPLAVSTTSMANSTHVRALPMVASDSEFSTSATPQKLMY